MASAALDHYSLSPNYTLTQRQSMMLLEQLAQKAVEQIKKLAHGGG